MKRIIKFSAITLSAIIILILVILPHSYRMVLEGYPAERWSSADNYAELSNDNARALGAFRSPPPTPKLAAIMENSSANALVAMRDGKLIFEHYSDGDNASTEFNSFSMVKSLVGILTLKALAENKISDLNDPISLYITETKDLEIGNTTIRSLLDMTSGLVFEKSSGIKGDETADKTAEAFTYNPFGNLAQLHIDGPLSVLSHIKVDESQSDKFVYQNLNTALLGLMLRSIYNMPLEELLFEKIWKPAGASAFKWRKYQTYNDISPHCCLYATPRDWVLVAEFIAKNGMDRNFLPAGLYNYLMGTDMTSSQLSDGEYRSQSRYNILDRDGEILSGSFIYFLGQGGQTTYLLPKYNLVVVRFGEKHQLLHSTLYEIGKIIK